MKKSSEFILEGIILTTLFYCCIFFSSCSDNILDTQETNDELIETSDTSGSVNTSDCLYAPYILSYWEKCGTHDLCSLDSFPIFCNLIDGTIVLNENNNSFVWTNLTTGQVIEGNHFIFVKKNEKVILAATLDDNCSYELDYFKDCD